jgi:hypothetical protein
MSDSERLTTAISFVRDDSAAMSYQSMGQYRSALLRVLGGVDNAGTKCDMATGPCACGAWHEDKDQGGKSYATFNGMAWPVPSERLDEVQWRMRYARESLTPEDLLLAASVICAYSELVMCETAKRESVALRICKST